MPSTYNEISLAGMNIDNVDWTGSRLRVSFGHGYGAFALTGNAAGLHKWKISDGGVLPDRTTADCLPFARSTAIAVRLLLRVFQGPHDRSRRDLHHRVARQKIPCSFQRRFTVV
jgi:hypothetical protein